MVVEYVRYRIPVAQSSDFEAAYARAAVSMDASEHCLGYELSRGVEEPDRYILRIEWDSIEGHEQGFRSGPLFEGFFAAVRPFFAQIEEMHHYERTAVAGRAQQPAILRDSEAGGA